MAWYNKAFEERRSGKAFWMRVIHEAGGWDGVAPLTRIEPRLRRPALRQLCIAFGRDAADWINDPWLCIDHYQDIWGYCVGLPPESDIPDVSYRGWLRLAIEQPDQNRGRWPTRSGLGSHPAGQI